MLKLFQAGDGLVRDLIVIHYLGLTAGIEAALRSASPTACIVIDTQAGPGKTPGTVDTSRYTRLGSGGADGILSLASVVRRTQDELVGRLDPFAIRWLIDCGFSAGGQGPTTHLNAGEAPDAVVICDGWHSSRPPGPMTSRKAFVARARRSDAVLALSHTQIQPPTYNSTRTTAELLTGWNGLDGLGGSLAEPVERRDGGLVVWSFMGSDARAHENQAQVVFAPLLTTAIATLGGLGVPSGRWLRHTAAPSVPPSEPAPATPIDGLRPVQRGDKGPAVTAWQEALATAGFSPGTIDGDFGPKTQAASDAFEAKLGALGDSLGSRALRFAVHELRCGVCEIPRGSHSNDGPRIRQYLALTGIPWAAEWCAAGFCFSANAVRRVDERLPHRISAAVHVIAETAGDALRLPAYYAPKPGDGVLLARPPGDPMKGGVGHVGRVLWTLDDGGYLEIGGNEGDAWRITRRSVTDPDFRRWIAYP